MKLLHAVAAFTAIFCAHAQAADSVKITYRDAIILSNALSALNGHDRVVKDGQKESVVTESYKFGPGLRLLIAKNIARLTPVVNVYQEAVKTMRAEVTNGKKVEDDSPQLAELNRRNDELLKGQEDIQPLLHFKASELKLEENPIPVTVLAALAPILDD